MGILNRFFKNRKGPGEKELADSIRQMNRLFEMDIGEIWGITEKNTFVIAICAWIARKCGYGKDMSALTPEEKAVYIVDSFYAEVNNGGCAQYLYNPSGAFVGDLFSSLCAVGDDRTAEIYRQISTLFPSGLPSDNEQRDRLLDEVLTAELSEELFSCDLAFYEYAQTLEDLLYRFILDHRPCFT